MTVLAPGQIAAIITHLEMTDRPRPAPLPAAPLRLARWKAPDASKYRTLFRRVGEPWLWFSRLVMADDALEAIIHDPAVEIHAVLDPKGIEVGMIELDFRTEGQCRIAFLGLALPLVGKGFGRWLMAHTLMLAWRKDVAKVVVHSCTLDHANALPFYIRMGFRAVAREIEQFTDPRTTGIVPADAAPHIPLL